ncbi:MAG: hypothetical protein TREMPRED_000573 [Tremellales sp. Tagirdzhanova-0007]|nr:MAG: hypothetical protein TREMPRED_000573 [Tremellales sp. Tagirdzhanova-0007]
MPPLLAACGSNGSGQLAISHSQDANTLRPCCFHPSLDSVIGNAQVLDLVSASTHSLLLLNLNTDSADPGNTSLLLGAGINSVGQLGPRCALWDEVKAETRFKAVDLLGPLGLAQADWEPIKIASTWTSSLVVYQRSPRAALGSDSSAVKEEFAEQMVLASGSNDFGELGTTRALDEGSPSNSSAKPTMVDLGLRRGEWVERVEGGSRHFVAVISAGNGDARKQRVVGWGAARKGELDVSVLVGESAFEPPREAKGKGKGKSVARPLTLPPTELNLPIPVDTHITDMSIGASHTLILLANGDVLAWGSDTKGQITGLTEIRGVNGIAATWGGSYILKDHEIWSQGSNNQSQLLRQTLDSDSALEPVRIEEGWRARDLVAGSEHVIIVASREDDESVWTGGWNEHGNLGMGDQTDRHELTRVDIKTAFPELGGRVKIRDAWGGCAATWVWLDFDRV